MGRTRPDTVDKAKLLHPLETHKLRRADEVELKRAQRNQVVEAVTDGTLRGDVRKHWLTRWRGVPERDARRRQVQLLVGGLPLFVVSFAGRSAGTSYMIVWLLCSWHGGIVPQRARGFIVEPASTESCRG